MTKHLLVFILSFVSCMEGKFTIKPNIETITSIRLDGYYYYFIDRGFAEGVRKSLGYKYDHYYDILFFYNNGVVFVPPIEFDSLQDLLSIEKALQKDDFRDVAFGRKGNANHWGMFKISGDIFTMEMKEAAPNLPIARSNFKIINDTTLVLIKLNSINKNYDFDQKGTWHFKNFHPKPDSSNRFTPKP